MAGSDFFARVAAVQAARERRAAELVAASPRGVKFRHADGVRRLLASPDLDEPGKGRLTWFDAAGPGGHMVFASLPAAVLAGMRWREYRVEVAS